MNEHNNDYNTLSAKIKTWAKEKGILDKATPIAQCDKTDEEVKELREALIAQNNGLETFTNSKGKKCGTKDEIKDALGDVFVTIIIGAIMQDLNLLDCLNSAYNVISKRNGVMRDGVFVKDKED